MLISEQWADLLTPGFTKIFFSEYDSIPSQIDTLFTRIKSSKSFEKFSSVGAFPSVSQFTGKIDYDKEPVQGYDKTVYFTEYAGGFMVQRSLAADDLYGIVSRWPEQFGMSVKRDREQLGADLFNNAFSFTPTDGDAKPLCADDHPSNADASYAGDNLITTALGLTGVSAARLQMRKFTDDVGKKIRVMGDLLIVPPDLEEVAWEIINSRGKVDTAENNANFHYGKYKLLVWDYLTDTNNWFLVDSRMMKKFLFWIDREPVQFFKDKDSDTLVAKYAVYYRCAVTWADWRWIIGANVS